MAHEGDEAPAPTIGERLHQLRWTGQWHLQHMPRRLVSAGVPPAVFGYRWMAEHTPATYLARMSADVSRRVTVVHPERTVGNPLPRNIGSRAALAADAGWWGYSFFDVPARVSAPTHITTLPHCRVVCCREGPKKNFSVAIVGQDDRAIILPQVAYRKHHAAVLRDASRRPYRLRRATWILERVYDNHSHWLTAHLPKLHLLRERGELDHVILPTRRTAAMDQSMRMLKLDPENFQQCDLERPLAVDELTVLSTDRFRPELLRPVRAALRSEGSGPPHRRIFISRAKSAGRQLLNEDDVWTMLRRRGFERVYMEDLDFPAQVRLMQETRVLLAPHGAGLTNMMFCPEGADVVEIADPHYPNPNFYALACAMGHGYWLIGAEALGSGHALTKDLRVDVRRLAAIVDRIDAAPTPAVATDAA